MDKSFRTLSRWIRRSKTPKKDSGGLSDRYMNPPSPRLSSEGNNYIIYAHLPHRRGSWVEPASELYVRTHSEAIAQYCLFGHDNCRELDSSVRYPEFDLESEGNRRICLRLRRYGTVGFKILSPFASKEGSDEYLRKYLMQFWKYISGWPHPIPAVGICRQCTASLGVSIDFKINSPDFAATSSTKHIWAS